MAAERFEIRIAGSGGQGVILATELIGQAITHYEPELYVVQSQAYGPEARGGKSKAEVVVPRPLDPLALQEGVTRALQARPGTVVPAG